ncbi:ArnT family glycosyltransferase [Methylobacillus flagellatus]|uniref:ArnT family glycosyltransferase n=1 Tax=Methylobacillus flagellatus TaxID=405 RepID=UPI0010F5627A|nr:glycosyltransferase family 39 protein [Methylobacillus flagellatus]
MMIHAHPRLYPALLTLVALIAAITLFWGLGDIGLMSFNEARRAIPTTHMLTSGDWLLPVMNGEIYIAKPPLIYWLAAACASLFSTLNEWTLRLPVAIAAAGMAVVAYRFALRRFGAWPALFVLLVLIANAGYAMLARRIEIEMLLATLCFFSYLCALKFSVEEAPISWLRLSYLLLGLAVLTKGPLALLFVTLPLLVLALHQRQSRYWKALTDPWSWLVLLLVGGSWYAVVSWQLGLDAWAATLQRDIVHKVHGENAEPLFNYLLWLGLDFLPFTLLLLARPLATLQRWKQQPMLLALLLAVLVPLLVFTAFSDKHAKYLLPVYPLIALLLGKRLGELFDGMGAKLQYNLLAFMLVLAVAYAAYYGVFERHLLHYRYQALTEFSLWLEQQPGLTMYGYKHLDERLVYYAKRDIPLVGDRDFARLKREGALLLVEGRDIARVRPLAGCVIRQFRPYLKQKKSLMVFGFGAACR